jgi:hypothetical protein
MPEKQRMRIPSATKQGVMLVSRLQVTLGQGRPCGQEGVITPPWRPWSIKATPLSAGTAGRCDSEFKMPLGLCSGGVALAVVSVVVVVVAAAAAVVVVVSSSSLSVRRCRQPPQHHTTRNNGTRGQT